jgi:hypothetical protein
MRAMTSSGAPGSAVACESRPNSARIFIEQPLVELGWPSVDGAGERRLGELLQILLDAGPLQRLSRSAVRID